MRRLYVVVEGQTEEAFVSRVLGPHLYRCSEVTTAAIIVSTKRSPAGEKTRGGGQWSKWAKDLRNLIRSQPSADVRFTTLFDLYGLPDDFPELAAHEKIEDTRARATRLEGKIGRALDFERRLIPYVQRHEFEALVLASLAALRAIVPTPADIVGVDELLTLVRATPPEEINDSKFTAPSKRLQSSVASYNKVLHGPAAIEQTGLLAVRSLCPRFDAWITKLENFGE